MLKLKLCWDSIHFPLDPRPEEELLDLCLNFLLSSKSDYNSSDSLIYERKIFLKYFFGLVSPI